MRQQAGLCACFTPVAAGLRLDQALASLLPHMGLRGRRRLCEQGLVLVRQKTAAPAYKVRGGEEVCLYSASAPLPEDYPEQTALSNPALVCHSEHLAVLYKPAGWHSASLEGGSPASIEEILPWLLASLHLSSPLSHSFTPVLLNRLDRPTSGLLLAALSPQGCREWQQAEELGQISKYYLTLVHGRVDAAFTIRSQLDTVNRVRTRVMAADNPDPRRHTHAAPLGFDPEQQISLLVCRIHKGARHQIRAHLAASGHPLVGDCLYDAPSCNAGYIDKTSPFFLHHGHFAAQLESGIMSCSVPPPWTADKPVGTQNTGLAALIRQAHLYTATWQQADTL